MKEDFIIKYYKNPLVLSGAFLFGYLLGAILTWNN
jgi:hypothetical protein